MNAPTALLKPDRSTPCVLIVDDAATIRRYHRMIVESAGLAAEEAFNGVEALERATLTPFDLYLVDVNMPELNGYGFVAELRRNPELYHAPVVMVSTEAEAADSSKAAAVGANFYLVKPALPDKLKTCLHLLLGGGANVTAE